MKKPFAPNRIYLNDPEGAFDRTPAHVEDVTCTWCEIPLNDGDVEYIRVESLKRKFEEALNDIQTDPVSELRSGLTLGLKVAISMLISDK